MEKKAEYKNSLRSKRLIKESFIGLLLEKPFEKITVTDIVKRADINRGTFYAHYSDINKLTQAIEQEILDVLCNLLLELDYINFIDNPLPLFLKISEHLDKNKDLIYALLNSTNTNTFIYKLPDLISKQLLSYDNLNQNSKSDPLFIEKCHFYAGGAASLYSAWFNGSLTGNLTDVAYTLSEIVLSKK